MRILHASYSKKVPIGVLNQLKFEIEAVQKVGISWDTRLFTTSRDDMDFIIKLNAKYPSPVQWLAVYFWLLKNQNKYDLILLRHIKSDLVGWLFMPFFKNILTIHHTKEIEECLLVSPKWYGILLSQIEKMFGWLKLKNVTGIGAVTDEIAKYENNRVGKKKPEFVIPNGINLNFNNKLIDGRNGPLKAVFIASRFEKWHGLELLLESYLEKKNIELKLLLIGQLSEKQKEIVHLVNKKGKRIHACGYVQGDEIDNIVCQADIGLSSFAMDKNNLTEACTLKVREYLSKGLPVFAGHRDSGLPDNFPYFAKGDADIKQIADYAKKFRKVGREEVFQASAPFIDKKEIIKRVYEELELRFVKGRE